MRPWYRSQSIENNSQQTQPTHAWTPTPQKLRDSKHVLSAKKVLSDSDDNNDIFFEELAINPYLTMPDSYPFQDNINLKMQWKQKDDT